MNLPNDELKNIRNTIGKQLFKKEKSDHTKFKLILGYPSLKDTIRKTFILCKPMSILKGKYLFPPLSQSSFYLVETHFCLIIEDKKIVKIPWMGRLAGYSP